MRTVVRALLAAVVLAAVAGIFWQHAQASRFAKPDVVTAIPVANDRSFMFSHAYVWNASAVFDGRIVMEHRSSMRVEAGGRFAFAQVSTVGQHYFDVVFFPFSSGGIWRHDGWGSIIVCELLAWELFGSLNVVGLYVRVGDGYYEVSGVVRDAAEPPGHVDGFAWLPQSPFNPHGYYAAIIHFIPDSYNFVHTNMEVLRILDLLGRRGADYVVIDINSYVLSIALRGQMLLSLAGLVFVFFMLRLAFYAWLQKTETAIVHSHIRRAWVFCIAVLCAVVFTLILPYLPVDFWLPAFYPGGLSGYARMFFNIGIYVPRQYLPSHLAALFDLNSLANRGFVVGLAALAALCAGSRKKLS